jgi:hypothetical protein
MYLHGMSFNTKMPGQRLPLSGSFIDLNCKCFLYITHNNCIATLWELLFLCYITSFQLQDQWTEWCTHASLNIYVCWDVSEWCSYVFMVFRKKTFLNLPWMYLIFHKIPEKYWWQVINLYLPMGGGTFLKRYSSF